mmetsp:Transcript_6463/g.10633  ORF Transcript_6463/g.10633 Transcript_6463/m.10633 type:complete len:370 (+) Transcript_6463:239-1348(+)|eukprot:CAMPEP_0194689120 /NCGR_PEP_ID=MMETSP0295-20121207/17391_1 /TAXON_ID=39354 /ORGANISM="Heterosigma akashiwo, Strain CCMP2393" /LENGTH=369 /DNA_ID=CAMNT_0039578039 /DNA_START=124 /DNA_END=1233 /DNA_ORIENTATION=+
MGLSHEEILASMKAAKKKEGEDNQATERDVNTAGKRPKKRKKKKRKRADLLKSDGTCTENSQLTDDQQNGVKEDLNASDNPSRKKKKKPKKKNEDGKKQQAGFLDSGRGNDGQEAGHLADKPQVFEYPYAVDEDDHCETCEEAYEDIATILEHIAEDLNKPKKCLQIYDPYFCQGLVIKSFEKLGFSSVYNKLEDFYEKVDSKSTPDFDVLVTNPPYSGDHIERILKFCIASKKPWFLLVPNWVYMKEYYMNLTKNIKPIYITPAKRYSYYSPRVSRTNVKSSERKTSPFPSFWYADLTARHGRAAAVFLANPTPTGGGGEGGGAHLARGPWQLPERYLDQNDPAKRRLRDLAKRKKKRKKKKSGGAEK